MSLPRSDQLERNELLDEKTPRNNPSKWRFPRQAISVIKAIVSSQKKSDTKSHVSSDHSFTSISIEPESKSLDVCRETLTQLIEDKDLQLLTELGGVKGIAVALDTNLENGLIRDTSQDIARRREKFGANKLKNPPRKSFLRFVWQGLFDSSIVILATCGALTLGFGIPVDVLESGKEGGSIFAAVFVAVAVVVWSEYWRSKVLAELHNAAENVRIDVVRGGRCQQVPMLEIVVGDVVFLKRGDQVPGHGLLLESRSVKLEGNDIELTPIGQQLFLFSGTKVVDGLARMLVTSVSLNKNEMSHNFSEETPLQRQLKAQLQLKAHLHTLDLVTDLVGYAIASIFVLLILIGNAVNFTYTDKNGQHLHGIAKINAIVSDIVGIITTIVNIPDPWMLSLTLTHVYAVKKLMADSAFVLKPAAFEALSYATTICIDKVGVLATDKVIKFWLPSGQEFVGETAYQSIIPIVRESLKEGIALSNVASLAEIAILSWATKDLKMDVEEVKRNHDIIETLESSSDREIIGILTKRKAGNVKVQVHWFGAAELILPMCSKYYDDFGIVRDINESQRSDFKEIIQGMAESSLKCIAFAQKQITTEELRANSLEKQKEMFILLGVVGIHTPCRVKDVMKECLKARIKVKLITKDNISMAKAIATECGILTSDGGEVIEGADFQKFSLKKRIDEVDTICVMASSTTSDEFLMVKCLKEKGEVVAIITDAQNIESTVTKEADAVVSMGIQRGTEDSVGIVILDGNFASVPKLLRWGRHVRSNIQKFIQFQLTTTIALLLANFVGIFLGTGLPLTTMQLLWLSVVTDTLSALAFSREKPAAKLMIDPPVCKTDPLITNIMLRNILPQTLYQMALLLAISRPSKMFHLNNDTVRSTFLFNSFLLCQVFNVFNSRTLEKKNVFQGLQNNKLFLSIIAFTVILQVLLVEILNKLADTERLSWSEWGVCAGIAFATLPIGWVARLIPVPKKEVFYYLMGLGQIKEYTERSILRKLRFLSLLTSGVLIRMQSNRRPRPFPRMTHRAGTEEE